MAGDGRKFFCGRISALQRVVELTLPEGGGADPAKGPPGCLQEISPKPPEHCTLRHYNHSGVVGRGEPSRGGLADTVKCNAKAESFSTVALNSRDDLQPRVP